MRNIYGVDILLCCFGDILSERWHTRTLLAPCSFGAAYYACHLRWLCHCSIPCNASKSKRLVVLPGNHRFLHKFFNNFPFYVDNNPIEYVDLFAQRNTLSEEESLTEDGWVFLARAAATGNERSPRVLQRVTGTSNSIASVDRKRRRPSIVDDSCRDPAKRVQYRGDSAGKQLPSTTMRRLSYGQHWFKLH